MIGLAFITTAVALAQPTMPVPYVDGISVRVWEDGSSRATLHGDSRIDAPKPRRIPTSRGWRCQAPMPNASLHCTTSFHGGGRLFRVVYDAIVGDVTMSITGGGDDG